MVVARYIRDSNFFCEAWCVLSDMNRIVIMDLGGWLSTKKKSVFFSKIISVGLNEDCCRRNLGVCNSFNNSNTQTIEFH